MLMAKGVKMTKILYKDLVYDIIGAAMKVHNILGYGFLEKVYENALIEEFRINKINAVQQCQIKVKYKGLVVGDYSADIVVDDKIIIELKATKTICDEHIAQTINYLRATDLRLGLLTNFGEHKLEYKRLIF